MYFSPTTLRLTDAAMIVWVLAWIWLGVAVHQHVQGLEQLSATVVDVGGAVEQTGASLQTLGDLPLVGSEISDVAVQVSQAGAEAASAGRASADSVRGLAWMLGLAVAAIPCLPLLLVYLPFRLARQRDQRALYELTRAHIADENFRRFLAHRAVFHRPYRQLSEMGTAPWLSYLAGEYELLVEAELGRAGSEGAPR